MFGYISKKKLINVVVDIYLKYDTDNAECKEDSFYRAGNVNALKYLCYKIDIDIVKEAEKAKERSEGK